MSAYPFAIVLVQTGVTGILGAAIFHLLRRVEAAEKEIASIRRATGASQHE